MTFSTMHSLDARLRKDSWLTVIEFGQVAERGKQATWINEALIRPHHALDLESIDWYARR